MVESELWVSLASKPLGIDKINCIAHTYEALCFKYSIQHPPHTRTHTHTQHSKVNDEGIISTDSSFHGSKLKELACQSLIFPPFSSCDFSQHSSAFFLFIFAWHWVKPNQQLPVPLLVCVHAVCATCLFYCSPLPAHPWSHMQASRFSYSNR